jgi:N-methylhydantoinase A
LTTPDDPTEGAIRGIGKLLQREHISAEGISRVIHATTLFTNALIERAGAKTALITTLGFRDTLELRREYKYDLYDLFIEVPQPLIPRDLRLEVIERVRADGSPEMPLDEKGILDIGRTLIDKGVESVAIAFLHAYANPAHERRARDLLEQNFPQLYVSISSEIAPQIREFERTTTTAVNAYIRPLADRYLEKMEEQLKQLGIRCPMLMMLSNGGLTHVGEARRVPVQLLESGPAAGAIAAAYFSTRSGIGDVLAFDMGGTTAKLSVIENGQPVIAYQFEAARERRFAPGSGMPINISTVELIEIGAGGGSIARLDQLNLLKVGPRSAASKPGPACYERGGTQPTVTDANLLVGHLNAETFAGGTMKLSRAAGSKAVATLAERLDHEIEPLANGILAVVNENMAAAARVHLAEKGHDISRFTLLVTGGGGPLHGCDVAQRLGVQRVICPPGAGVASALGLLIAPARIDRVRSIARELRSMGFLELEKMFAALERDAASVIESALAPGAAYEFQRAADIRFVGQGFEIVTPLPKGPFDKNTIDRIRAEFSELYSHIFGQAPPVQEIELINLRVAAVEKRRERPLKLDGEEARKQTKRDRRDVWSGARGAWRKVAVLPRDMLDDGNAQSGPMVIEEASSTLILPAGASVSRDPAGNLIVDLNGAGEEDGDAAMPRATEPAGVE